MSIVWHCRETGETRTEPPAIDDDRRWEAMHPIRSAYGVALVPEGDHFDIDRMVWWEFRWPDGAARRPRGLPC